MRRRVMLAGLLVALVAVLVVAAPWRGWLAALAAWAASAGPWGVAAFVAAYVAGSALALPVWPLTVVAGIAYGTGRGFALALPAGTLGATVAFLAGRTLLRGWVARRVAREPRLAALDEAVSRQGAFLVLLLRLSPLAPYNVVNYALSASRVRATAFAAASFVGMAPITLAWAWTGATFGSLEGIGVRPPPGPASRVLQWGGLLATVAVVLLLARMGRRALAARASSAPGTQ